MGCISSKVINKSRSFRDELSQSLQRRANGFPLLEELLISKNGGDQFLALVCTANTVTKKLRTGSSVTSESSTDNKSPVRPTNPEIINTWELMVGLEEEEELQSVQAERSINDISKRSKSFHWSNENSFEFEGIKEHVTDNRGIVRSRSFHTIQEYDALVLDRADWLSNSKERDDTDVKVQPLEGNNKQESSEIETEDLFITSGNDEKGLRRKAMAKELTSLRIPSTIEFPSIGSLREWLDEVGGPSVYNPGGYVTPKFGSFGLPASMENSVFDPEMVADFEEALQQLQVEEDCILKRIAENQEEDGNKEKKDEEETAPHVQQ